MAPVSSFTAPYGARMAHALSGRALEIAFESLQLRAPNNMSVRRPSAQEYAETIPH